MSDRNECCASCRFWDDWHKGTDISGAEGYCRRYPPTVVPHYIAFRESGVFTITSDGEEDNTSASPVSLGDEWCGEYVRKQE